VELIPAQPTSFLITSSKLLRKETLYALTIRILKSKVNELTENYGSFPYAYKHRESLITAISAGFFLILIGALFITTPGLFSRIIDFFNNFDALVQVPNTMIYLPAPRNPLIPHQVVYTAVEQFGFAFGAFQIVTLALRFVARSPISRKAETVGNFIFWIGLGYLTRTLLLQQTRWTAMPTTAWFVFWAAIVMLIGVTLIIRALILATAIPRRMM